MNSSRKTELDPFRAILATIAAANNSDTLVQAAGFAGIKFDGKLSERDGYTHAMRIRALTPRIEAAYDSLSDTDRLVAANAMLASLALRNSKIAEAVAEALAKIGWSAIGSQLSVAAPEIREMFFPKGSPWDAFVVLKGVLAEAKSDALIIDAYCNGDVFHLLAPRPGLSVRILCSKNAEPLAAEATRFVGQHPGVSIEVRKTKDFHDRFVVLNNQACIHIGASLKDAGKTAFMISRIEDDANRMALLDSAAKAWAAGTPVP